MSNGNMKAAVENAQTMANCVDALLNGEGKRNVGFALLFFPLDEDGRKLVNYVGNCERKDMLVAMKEIVARWEGQPEASGRA